MMIIPLAAFKRRVPWWGIPYNYVSVKLWSSGEYEADNLSAFSLSSVSWLELRRQSLCGQLTIDLALCIVWGNLAGSLFFAAILTRYTHLATGDVRTFILNTAQTRGNLAWHEVFLRGIGCNIMGENSTSWRARSRRC